MPKLPVAEQEKAQEEANASKDFGALEQGVYTGRLSKVTATQSKTKKPMWDLEFSDIKDWQGKKVPGRQWNHMTIEDSTMWKVAQFYSAFGVPTSVDSDELVGYRIRLEISKYRQTVGKNAGKDSNNIDRFAPLLPDDEGYEAGQKLIKMLAADAPAKPVTVAAATQTAAKAAEPAPSSGMDEFAPAAEPASPAQVAAANGLHDDSGTVDF